MFAEDLKAKLKESHMSQKELSSYLNSPQSCISRWCNGKAQPRQREFDMICDLFELSRERYTAERNPKRKEFTPKHYIDPDVKEKESKWVNPYKTVKPEKLTFDTPPEEPFRCDLAVKDLERKVAGLESVVNTQGEMLTELDNAVSESTQNRWDDTEKLMKKIDDLYDKINYLRGMIDGTYTSMEESKGSWWKRLWS